MAATDSGPSPENEQLPEIGDPVIDLANGRNLIVIARTAASVEEWNKNHSYDLLENTGNQALGTSPMDPVFECVYVNDVSSLPSKTYDFPVSRLGRPRYENATSDGLRVRDIITRAVLSSLFAACDGEDELQKTLSQLTARAGLPGPLVSEAREMAEAATITADGNGDDST